MHKGATGRIPGFTSHLTFFDPAGPAGTAWIRAGIPGEGVPRPTPKFREIFGMDLETTALILGVVLPLYPALFAVYEKIGKYEVICAEFTALLKEHEQMKETRLWNRN